MGVHGGELRGLAEARDLQRLIGGYRLRVGLEQLVAYALRAVALGLAAIAVIQLAAWLLRLPTPLPASLALPALALLAALGLALLRWPSGERAARAADARLGLDERLGTALEVVRGQPGGHFGQAQVRDSVRVARVDGAHWSWAVGGLRRDATVLLGTGLLAAAAAALMLQGDTLSPVLPALPNPFARSSEAALPAALPTAVAQPVTVAAPPKPAQRSGALTQQQIQQAQAELDRKAQESQQQRQALDQLGNALRQTSAVVPAADAIERGDYNAASQELQNLGTQADQLSPAAKQQLAQALQQAAQNTADNPDLAKAEQEAADALQRGTYEQQRDALQQLGETAQQAGQQVVPQGELARQADQLQQARENVGQGQSASGSQQQGQRQALGSPSSNSNGQQGSQASQDGQQGSQGDRQGGDTPSAQAGGQNSQPNAGQQGGAQGQAQVGGQSGSGGSGAGTGSGDRQGGGSTDGLDTVGQQVDVPVQMQPGAANGPASKPGEQEQVGQAAIAGTGAPPANVGDPVSVPSEENRVPSDQRQIVRDYFSGSGDTGQP